MEPCNRRTRRARQRRAATAATVTVTATVVTITGANAGAGVGGVSITADDTRDTMQFVFALVSFRCGVRPGAISALGDWTTGKAVLSP
jgi:hypothetical protein